MRKKKPFASKDVVKTDAHGFPDPGSIIKQYRKKMTYIDSATGKVRHWTQADLARRSGVSEVTVRLMENQNKGLDSIERRRILADILKIPPALLGLATLPAILGSLAGDSEASGLVAGLAKPTGVGPETVKLYRAAFDTYNNLHTSSTAHTSIYDVEMWIQRMQHDMPNARDSQKRELYHILWGFHALSSKIYSDDMSDWEHAFEHLNRAFEVASLLQDSNLQAATLYRSGQVRFEQGAFALAKVDLDGAMLYAKQAEPSTKGAVLAATGLAYALTTTDLAGKTYAQRLFDQAEKCAGQACPDTTYVKYGMTKYLMERVDALITLGRPAKALELLEDAHGIIDPTQTRRLAYINILHAEAYMKIRHPEYDTAVNFLAEALEASKKINSLYNINYVGRLYAILAESNYGSSPQATDLRLALRDWQRSH